MQIASISNLNISSPAQSVPPGGSQSVQLAEGFDFRIPIIRVLSAISKAVVGLVVFLGILAFRPAWGYTPESPEVKRAIARAVTYLEANVDKEEREGGKALVGLTLVKNGAPTEHPTVQKVVAALKARLKEKDYDPKKLNFEYIYSPGIMAIFFVNCDAALYQREIKCLLDYLIYVQKPHGGWGYPNMETGDTSMTQYSMLAFWEAKQEKINVPANSISRATQWLLLTQDPSGGFGYQGVPTTDGKLVPQQNVQISLTAAGGGCLYMAADFLRLEVARSQDASSPSVLREVVTNKENRREEERPTVQLDFGRFRQAQEQADRWIRTNFTPEPKLDFFHYYLYSLERYMSFREYLERGVQKELPWYDEGVKYLLRTQAADGSWESKGGAVPDTAFGALFLMRSMKKRIDKLKSLGSGLLIGGRGLPKDTDRAVIRGGQVVASARVKRVEDLIELLNDSESDKFDEKAAALADLPSQQVEALLAAHGSAFRALTKRQSPQVRLAAVLALGKTRDLDNVPALIYALGDSDPEIVREARNGLRRIRRNPKEFGPPDNFNDPQREDAIKQWKAWYRSVRPEADVDF